MLNEKVWDLKICKDVDILKQANKLILYGAAEKGREVNAWLQEAGIRPDFFCDKDPKKWGKSFEHIEIISPFELKQIAENNNQPIQLIACIAYPEELQMLLERMGIKNYAMCTYWGINMSIHINADRLYGKNSKSMTLFQIENEKRKNKFMDMGWDFMHSLMSVSDEAIWIMQPGKTASTTLKNRLIEKGIPCIAEHYLEYPNHVIGEEYREAWEKQVSERRKKPLKIIAAVREPLSRDYSAFWQAFSEVSDRAFLMPILKNDFQEMYNSYTDLILKGSAYTKATLGVSMPYTWNDEFEWFDEQIKKHLGIDVFQYPFDQEKGYTMIKEGTIEIMLCKTERVDDLLDVICSFVQTNELSRTNANVAKQKWYSMVYSQFRKEVRLSEEYVNHYYVGNSKMDHFYSDAEKKRYLESWRKNIRFE